MKNPVKVNDKDVVIHPLKLFDRLILISEREITIEESLRYELTQVPMRLIDTYQRMRKANKAAFGTYLKSLTSPVLQENANHMVIDGGWLLYQGSFKLGDTALMEKLLSIIYINYPRTDQG